MFAVMDYSKAQMVSVDDCVVTLPLVFVTVTKQMTINATTAFLSYVINVL